MRANMVPEPRLLDRIRNENPDRIDPITRNERLSGTSRVLIEVCHSERLFEIPIVEVHQLLCYVERVVCHPRFRDRIVNRTAVDADSSQDDDLLIEHEL